jgi:thiamine pyrophosphate-dependent acetolactate synthase large subunit-like protein
MPTVRHATWELLRALGVRTVFGNPGSTKMMKGTLPQWN